MQESGVHVVVCYVPLGDELVAEGIVGRLTRNLGKTEEFSDELQASEVGGSDTLNPTTDTIAAPEIVDIRLVRPFAMAKKVHPCLVAQASILLNMKSLNSLPKLPHAPALMLVNKLEMQLIRGASDDTHGDLLRLTPASELSCVGGRGGISDHTSHACCAHEDTDVVVGREVCLEGSLPSHIILLREHWQVPVAGQGASGIERHSGGCGGDDGGTTVLCRPRRRTEGHNP